MQKNNGYGEVFRRVVRRSRNELDRLRAIHRRRRSSCLPRRYGKSSIVRKAIEERNAAAAHGGRTVSTTALRRLPRATRARPVGRDAPHEPRCARNARRRPQRSARRAAEHAAGSGLSSGVRLTGRVPRRQHVLTRPHREAGAPSRRCARRSRRIGPSTAEASSTSCARRPARGNRVRLSGSERASWSGCSAEAGVYKAGPVMGCRKSPPIASGVQSGPVRATKCGRRQAWLAVGGWRQSPVRYESRTGMEMPRGKVADSKICTGLDAAARRARRDLEDTCSASRSRSGGLRAAGSSDGRELLGGDVRARYRLGALTVQA